MIPSPRQAHEFTPETNQTTGGNDKLNWCVHCHQLAYPAFPATLTEPLDTATDAIFRDIQHQALVRFGLTAADSRLPAAGRLEIHNLRAS